MVGDECMEMVRDGAELQSAPDDPSLRRALTDQCRVVAEKVSETQLSVLALPVTLYEAARHCLV